MYFVLFFLVFAQLRLRQNRPRLFGIAEDSPLFSGLQHLTSCLSASYALFSLTAIFQPFSFQSLPHSFHPDGGCTPSLHVCRLLYPDLYAKSFGIKLLANPHQLTLMESHSYKNIGGGSVQSEGPREEAGSAVGCAASPDRVTYTASRTLEPRSSAARKYGAPGRCTLARGAMAAAKTWVKTTGPAMPVMARSELIAPCSFPWEE